MSEILVTGGAGFIGSHVVDRLLSFGEKVVCLDNFDPFYDTERKKRNLVEARKNPRFTMVAGDIRDEKLLKRLFANHRIEVIVHAAAKAGVRPSLLDPLSYQDVNVRGTLNLLEMAKEKKVRNVVFASSSSVYGKSTKVPFTEDDPCHEPVSPYAATKRAGELLCSTYHHLYGLHITCLRFFTVYGPRQRPEMAIHAFTRLIDEGKPLPLYGDGTSQRDYTYIDDAIEGTVKAIERAYPCEVFNIGESRCTQLLDLVALLEGMLGKKARVKRLPPQKGDVPLTYAGVEKAERMLGYTPRTDLTEGMKKFIGWYREEKG